MTQGGAAPAPHKVLIAAANPLAVERYYATSSRAVVDIVNLFRLCAAASPHWRRCDRLIERANGKINRFSRGALGASAMMHDAAAIDAFTCAPS